MEAGSQLEPDRKEKGESSIAFHLEDEISRELAVGECETQGMDD